MEDYLIYCYPVPRAALISRCISESDCSIGDFTPLLTDLQLHQGHSHLEGELEGIKRGINPEEESNCAKKKMELRRVSHMQGEQGRNGLVVADGVAHVTSVRVLRHFGGPPEPRGQTPLQCCIVGRDRGAGASEAPEDAIRPGRFPLLCTDTKRNQRDRSSIRPHF